MMGRVSRPRHHVLTVVTLLLVSALVAAGSFVGWQVAGTNIVARGKARQALAATQTGWPSDVVAVLTIPSIGLTWPVAASVSSDALGRGLGWYPWTAAPGAVGNCAIAGQRVGHGAPFADLLQVPAGAEVRLTTRTQRFTYRVVVPAAHLTVNRDASWVLSEVPGHPGLQGTKALLTLTTAQDLVDSGDRAVLFATLVSSGR